MAQYKYEKYLNKSEHSEYDSIYKPGEICQNSGIYRCEECGDEIASNKGNPFPLSHNGQQQT